MSAVEWAPFVINKGVDEGVVIEHAEAVQRDFIQHQAGFVRRELIRKNEREYADVLYWTSNNEAVAASDKVMDHDVCKAYFELMDGSVEAGAGFAHYEVLRCWPDR